MAPERRLIALEDSSQSGIQCTSNVIGVIPPKINEILSSSRSFQDDGGCSNDKPLKQGRIDDHGSGISYLVGAEEGNLGAIWLWEHSSQTLSEELVAPEGYLTLTHPEYDTGNNDDDTTDMPDANETNNEPPSLSESPLVVCLGPSAKLSGSTLGRSHAASSSSSSLRHIYAASPSGVICLWMLDTNAFSPNGLARSTRYMENNRLECDASICLPLRPGEVVTVLAPISDNVGACAGNAARDGFGGGWLLAGTSFGRLWRMMKTSRPLELHAKLVKEGKLPTKNSAPEANDDRGGIVKGLYNSLLWMTPGKKTREEVSLASVTPRQSQDREGSFYEDEMMDVSSKEEDNKIVALVSLPHITEDKAAVVNNATEEPLIRSPPPRKVQRILSPSSMTPGPTPVDNAPHARVLSLSSSLQLKEWRVMLTSGAAAENGSIGVRYAKEGCLSQTQLFPRNADGTFANLGKTLCSSTQNDDFDDLEGYRNLDIIAPPKLAKDGRSLLVAIRIGGKDNGEMINNYGNTYVDGSTRVYLLRIALIESTLSSENYANNNIPYILDVVWLDRYSGESLSRIGGTLKCSGLVTAEDDNEEDIDISIGGVLAYLAFGLREGSGASSRSCPVTISVACFPRICEGQEEAKQPRVKDLDLFHNIVPSVVNGTVSYDSTTGGCMFLSSTGLLGGAFVRFSSQLEGSRAVTVAESEEDAGLDDLSRSIEALSQDDNVLTIKSHLLSSFHQYRNRLRETGANPASVARMVIPPSTGAASTAALSAAVVLASASMSCSTTSGNVASIPSSASTATTPISMVTVLRNKLDRHGDFVNFLVHAGAYRKVSTAGRIRLRDHGEVMAAAHATLTECQGYVSTVITSNHGVSDEDASQLRQIINNALAGISDNIVNLPRCWARLQQLSLNDFIHINNAGSLPSSESKYVLSDKDLLLLASNAICAGVGKALQHREEKSGTLYDVISFDSGSKGTAAPWTSSPDVLIVLRTQLEHIRQMGETVISSSFHNETNAKYLERLVEDMSAALLGGYRDIVCREGQNSQVMQYYEEAKLLVIPLLKLYVNEDRDDLVALNASLDHSYFDGIVSICHDHRKAWMYVDIEEADQTYDLRAMLSNNPVDSMYAHLHESKDYRTGLSFCEYVLCWYTDRGSYPKVLELGNLCPDVLTRFLHSDARMSNLAWIHDLRTGSYESATSGLLDVTSSVIFSSKQVEAPMGLWEKEQLMSLAKLSNKLSQKTLPSTVGSSRRSAIIENSITLINAQRMLQEDDIEEDESDVILSSDELLVLAVNKIKSARDTVEMKKYGICGLAIAHATSSVTGDGNAVDRNNYAMVNGAAIIWEACIHVDIHLWNNLARENSSTVAGMPENDLIQRVEGTAFVGLVYDFATTSKEAMDEVGFWSNPNVRDRVIQSLQLSKDLVKLLLICAEMTLSNLS